MDRMPTNVSGMEHVTAKLYLILDNSMNIMDVQEI